MRHETQITWIGILIDMLRGIVTLSFNNHDGRKFKMECDHKDKLGANGIAYYKWNNGRQV